MKKEEVQMESKDFLLQCTDGDSNRQEFYERLYAIHEEEGTPLRRPPMVSGNVVDLYSFHQKVQDLGGYRKLTEGRRWTSTARMMYPNLPYNQMLRAGYLLRNYYLKLLMPYDDMCGPESEKKKQLQVAMGTPLGLSNRSPLPLSFTPMPATVQRLQLPTPHTAATTPLRDLPGLRVEEPEPTGLNLHKLLRSLEGGFPNEVDFTFNVLLMISSDDSIEIQKEPRLLELMMAHVAVLPADPSLQELHSLWYSDVELCVEKFWQKSVPQNVRQDLLPYLGECDDESNPLFHSEFNLGTRLCVEAYRVAQALTVLLNFSSRSELLPYLVECDEVIKFLVLASYCPSPELSVVAVDALGNIAVEIELNYSKRYQIGVQLINMVEVLIMSHDCHMIIRGLEILEGLATTEDNIPFVTNISKCVYVKIVNLLLLRDLQLLSASLECLVALSHYEDTSTILMDSTDTIGIFLSLITYQSSSLDSGSLEGLVIYKPLMDPSSPPSVKHATSTVSQISRPGVKKGIVSSPMAGGTTVVASKNLTQLNPELIATSWLKTCYEEAAGDRVSWVEMCALYNGYCTKLGKMGTVNSTGFLTLAKKVFPTAVLTKANVGKNQVIVVMIGVRKRSPQTNPVLHLSQEAVKMMQLPSASSLLSSSSSLLPPSSSSLLPPSSSSLLPPSSSSLLSPLSSKSTPLIPSQPSVSTVPVVSSTHAASTIAMATTVSTPRTQPLASAPLSSPSTSVMKGVICKPNVVKVTGSVASHSVHVASKPLHIASHSTSVMSSEQTANPGHTIQDTNGIAAGMVPRPESIPTSIAQFQNENGKNAINYKDKLHSTQNCNLSKHSSHLELSGSFKDKGAPNCQDLSETPSMMNGDATSEEITHFSSRQTGKHHVRNEKLEQDRLKIGQTDVDVDVDVVAMDTSPLVPTECSTHGPNTDVGNGESENLKNDPMEPSIVLMSDINDCDVVEVEGEIEVPSEDSERRTFLKSVEGREWLLRHPEQKVCLWDGCYTLHSGDSALERHMYCDHINFEKDSLVSSCKWDHCDNLVSRRWTSLLLHLRDTHFCTDQLPKKAPPNPQEIVSRMRCVEPFKTEHQDVLSNSIQMSTALILRNLARNSSQARNLLSAHVSKLAEVVLSESEVAVIIAECLHYVAHDNEDML